ncbi:MAG TPA: thiamine pyrophosphate-dependent enzyme [Acidimicrobiia bacterium]|nr:thiamine pyrophosphate-dependent enzyme [Acidimicrobiia bacterium]
MTMERLDLFRALAAVRRDEIVITTMTATLQWPLVSQHELDFDFLAFGMGHASDFGLGLALARPERKVIVLKGDGGLLMSLGSLVTMGRYGPPNFLVLLLENRSYEMTGGQQYAPDVDFVTLARGAGIEKVERIEDLPTVEAELPRLLAELGPHFVVVPVTNSEPLPPVAHTDHAGRVTDLRRALGVEDR